MILDDLKDEVVLIKLRGHEELVIFGISSANICVKIIEIDDRVGVWVENPKWSPKRDIQDQEGQIAQILIRWEYVIGIMTFPEGESLEDEEDIQPIGFVS